MAAEGEVLTPVSEFILRITIEQKSRCTAVFCSISL
jgi:hypothetical protein